MTQSGGGKASQVPESSPKEHIAPAMGWTAILKWRLGQTWRPSLSPPGSSSYLTLWKPCLPACLPGDGELVQNNPRTFSNACCEMERREDECPKSTPQQAPQQASLRSRKRPFIRGEHLRAQSKQSEARLSTGLGLKEKMWVLYLVLPPWAWWC